MISGSDTVSNITKTVKFMYLFISQIWKTMSLDYSGILEISAKCSGLSDPVIFILTSSSTMYVHQLVIFSPVNDAKLMFFMWVKVA